MGLAGRRGAPQRWRAWVDGGEGGSGPLVWLHAASVGEALAAEPVARRLRAALPGLRVALTHTSPSVDRPLAGADHADFLPFDEPGPIARTLDALRPDLLWFSRGDLWPELVRQAHARDVPLAVTGGVVRPGSGRLRWPARAVLTPACRMLDYLGAVTDADAERWRRLGVRDDRIEVTGDPRHDQLVERAVRLEAIEPLRSWARGCVVVAGSVEREDLRVMGPALADPAVRWLVVPHVPSPSVTKRWLTAARAQGVPAAPWSGSGSPPADARLLVVTVAGLLADLYALGSIAYVGGGFRRHGLHAVAEPAALGLPVVFGPHWRAAADAPALVASGGGVAVAGADQLLDQIGCWATAPGERVAAGVRARAAIVGGAAGRSTSALLRLVRRPSPS
jgi:3-deoxy-D-manno-octulosonic-acid transferase